MSHYLASNATAIIELNKHCLTNNRSVWRVSVYNGFYILHYTFIPEYSNYHIHAYAQHAPTTALAELELCSKYIILYNSKEMSLKWSHT